MKFFQEGDAVKATRRIESNTARGSLRVIPAGTRGVVLQYLNLEQGPLDRIEVRFQMKKAVDVWTYAGCVESVG